MLAPPVYLCVHMSIYPYTIAIGINNCSDGDVRLVGGSSPTEGRVEICFDRLWGTICGSNWDYRDAAVTCRQLGLPAIGLLRLLTFCLLQLNHEIGALKYTLCIYFAFDYIYALFIGKTPYDRGLTRMPFAVELLCASTVCVLSMPVCGTFQPYWIKVSALATLVSIQPKYFGQYLTLFWEKEYVTHTNMDGRQTATARSDSTANSIRVRLQSWGIFPVVCCA